MQFDKMHDAYLHHFKFLFNEKGLAYFPLALHAESCSLLLGHLLTIVLYNSVTFFATQKPIFLGMIDSNVRARRDLFFPFSS